MAYANKIVVAILFVLGAGLLFLSGSETTFGQPLEPGCCITNGNQCSPSCGPAGTSCQNPGTFNPCKNEVDISNVLDCGTTEVNCFVVGAVCLQVTNSKGECRGAAPPEQTGCCGNIPDGMETCQDGITFNECSGLGGTFSSAGSCQEDNSCFTPAAVTGVPTLSQWGMIIMAGFLGLIGIYFGTRRFALRRSS